MDCHALRARNDGRLFITNNKTRCRIPSGRDRKEISA